MFKYINVFTLIQRYATVGQHFLWVFKRETTGQKLIVWKR